MRLASLLLLSVLIAACQQPQEEPAPAASSASPPANTVQPKPSPFPLAVAGTGFSDREGRPFEWRGITAFRLAAMIAGGREQEATAYLDWAASEELTVLRVLLTAQHLFPLAPEAGRAALPRLLDLAKERGLAVEAVALADTAGRTFDLEAHVREVGRIAAEKGNALVEIANEPGHPTQDKRLHEPAFVKRLADLVPAPVIVALGSVEYGEGFAAGDYATFHFPRGTREWDHVLALQEGARRLEQLKKPVISDEPMGAGREHQPGRRDNDPARFAAAGALSRFTGMGATFHYEGGLQAEIPRGREAACLAAWQLGQALASGVPKDGALLSGDRFAAGMSKGGRQTFSRISGVRGAVLIIDPDPSVTVSLEKGWREVRRNGVPGVLVILLEKT